MKILQFISLHNYVYADSVNLHHKHHKEDTKKFLLDANKTDWSSNEHIIKLN